MGLCSRFPQHRSFGHYYMGYLPWDKPAKIEVVSGAFCLIRREALLKVGLLDEDFFMYGEDIDLSYRILKGGYQNYYLPVDILSLQKVKVLRSRASAMFMCFTRRCLSSSVNIIRVCRISSVFLSNLPSMPVPL